MANCLGREQGIVLCREGQVCLLSNVRKIVLPLEQCSDKLTAHHKRQAHEAWVSPRKATLCPGKAAPGLCHVNLWELGLGGQAPMLVLWVLLWL